MRKRFFLQFSLVFFLLITIISVNAQQFDSLLNKLDSEYPQEKIYCQFDKNVYNPGETIWFKAYLFSGSNLSLISKTLYADLLDDKGNLLERKTAPLLQSSAASSFTLSEKISSPVVYIKVYTRWMLNFDSAFLFVKAIPVIIPKRPVAKTSKIISQVSLQFFPEGGDLVEGVESRVAFKATDKKGLPSNVSGDVFDSKSQKIKSFTSVHDGMGYFMFKPSGETYTARWKDGYGQQHETMLPAAKKIGIVLEVNNAGDTIGFLIKCSENLPDNYSSVSITGQMNQQLLFTAKANLKSGKIVHGNIPIDNVPAGIAQITVFTSNAQPVAERITFLHQQSSSFITDLNAALKDMAKRKKNVIQIDVPDTTACNLSIAITDASVNVTGKGDDNIFSHLLLTGDIKGYVYNPGYYFSSDADSVIANLDLVMLTNGWRRFRWENVLTDKWPLLKYGPENYLSAKGKVFGLSTLQLANKELSGMLIVKNGNTQFINVPVQKDGNFSLPPMIFYDTAKLYYQFNNDKDKVLTSTASYQISNDFLKEQLRNETDSSWLTGIKFPDSATVQKNKLASSFAEQDRLKKVKVLSTVVIKVKQRSKADSMDAAYTSGLFSGGDANTFILENDPFANNSNTVLSYLQGKVAGLSITVNGQQASLSWRGGTPTLYLNEMETQVDQIQSLPLSDVAMIKVFRPPFFGSTGGGSGGAIAVYLKKGASRNADVKGLNFLNIPGYSLVKEFYSPDYSQEPQDDTGDYRSTLYWSPYVITDKTHRRIFIPFYNNDITKKIRVIIEGCNADGKLTREEKIFE